jgi:hypothetical protein
MMIRLFTVLSAPSSVFFGVAAQRFVFVQIFIIGKNQL